MNMKQFERIRDDKGFIAALDQSGGSTPKALLAYGLDETNYNSEEEMFNIVHQMRTRIITSPAFNANHILGAILFENTMDRQIDGKYTADYLWDVKGVVPFLKIDKGLDILDNGVQLMKAIPGLDKLLDRAVERNIFGTKMRSVVLKANPQGIAAIVQQQFDFASQILKKGLIPIIEPEVDINIPDKEAAELILKDEIRKQLDTLKKDEYVMLKLSIPTVSGFYTDLMSHPNVLRIVALSGGYSRQEADEKLTDNPGLIASFSRALVEGISAQQSDDEFNETLGNSIAEIYQASIT